MNLVTSPDFSGQNFVKSGDFEVEVFGTRYPAQCRLNPPVLPKKVEIDILITAVGFAIFSSPSPEMSCILGNAGGAWGLPSYQTLVKKIHQSLSALLAA